MQPDVASAQATALLDFAEQWQHEATVEQGSDAERIAIELRRCANMIRRGAGLAALPIEEGDLNLPDPPHQSEMRPD